MAVLAQRAINIFFVLILFKGLYAFCHGTYASTQGEKIGKVLRFMSTRSCEVNLRRGPGRHYPIDWKIIKANYPLHVIAEYGTWRKVRDFEKTEGWVHQGMLTHRRSGVTLAQTALLKKPDGGSRPIALLEPKVFVSILEIKPAWCRVAVEKYSGWVQRSHLWGVLDNE